MSHVDCDIRGSARDAHTGRQPIPNDAGLVDLADHPIAYGPEPDYCAPTATVIATIPFGRRTGDVVIRDSFRAFAALSNSIAVISCNNDILGITAMNRHPKGLTIGADGSRLYVANYEVSISISAVDVADHQVHVIRGASCAQEVITADREFIYAAHNAQNASRRASVISVNDTQSAKLTTIPGIDSYTICDPVVNPDGARVALARSALRRKFPNPNSQARTTLPDDADSVMDCYRYPPAILYGAVPNPKCVCRSVFAKQGHPKNLTRQPGRRVLKKQQCHPPSATTTTLKE